MRASDPSCRSRIGYPVIRVAGYRGQGVKNMQVGLMALHGRTYSTASFWQKLQRQARRAGRELVEKALWLYFAAQRPQTPRWARLTVYGALAYFILPADAVPDLLPGAGYVDDLGVLTTALVTIAAYVDDEVRERAAALTARWFA